MLQLLAIVGQKQWGQLSKRFVNALVLQSTVEKLLQW
jgi:hypothetical protein